MRFSADNEYIKEIDLFSMLSKRLTFRALALPLIAAALCAPLQAAELGEVKVNSHIGQQLSADIELVDLTPADLADLQARLANPDVFKGANLTMPPVLGGLHISVARRDNRRFLHLTTLQPVNAEALHLFLELNSGGRQIIRAASLWLTPEPPAQRIARSVAMPAAAPIPAPAPATAPVPAPAVSSPPASAGGEAGLSEAAQRAFEHRKRVAMAQAAAAPTASAAPEVTATPAPSAPVAVAPKVAAPNTASPAVPTRAARSAGNATEPSRVAAAAPAPAPKPAAAPVAAAPACAPAQQVEAQLQQCQVMNTKLVDIEGRVQRLQAAMTTPSAVGAAGAIAPVAPPKSAAAPAKPGTAPSKPGAAAVKPGVAAELAGKSSNRMLMIGAGVLSGLAVLGGFIYFLRKRKDKGPLKIWQSFRKKGAAEAKEPTLEAQVEVATQE